MSAKELKKNAKGRKREERVKIANTRFETTRFGNSQLTSGATVP